MIGMPGKRQQEAALVARCLQSLTRCNPKEPIIVGGEAFPGCPALAANAQLRFGLYQVLGMSVYDKRRKSLSGSSYCMTQAWSGSVHEEMD